MKRFIASLLLVGASTFGIVGCDQKSEVKDVKTTDTPGGKVTETDVKKVEKSGEAKDPAPVVEPPK